MECWKKKDGNRQNATFPGPPRDRTPKASKQRRRIGRPPAGARVGEKVKDYPQLSIRLPGDVKARLQALSLIASKPQWRGITPATHCYLPERTPPGRRTGAQLVGPPQTPPRST